MSDPERLRRLVIRCGELYGIDSQVVLQMPRAKLVKVASSIMAIAEHKRRIAELTNGFQGSRH